MALDCPLDLAIIQTCLIDAKWPLASAGNFLGTFEANLLRTNGSAMVNRGFNVSDTNSGVIILQACRNFAML